VWELIAASRWFGHWEADAGALWSMDDLRFPSGSTTASGLPVLAGLLTYQDVAAGSVQHVMLAGSPVIGRLPPVWPARGSDGTSTVPGAPPMGSWLRLRADVALDGLSPQAKVVAEGLQRYGMVLVDTAGSFGVSSTPDRRWDGADLATLARLSAADFEVVDASGIEVSADSMEARPPG
jgi:hypothetical protein